ncbi:MAG: sensor histidine kinase [Acidimicrobiales bacterium]
MRNAFYSALNEPAVANPAPRVWRDWALVAALAVTAVIETFVRPELGWPAFSLVSCLVLLPTLLWRRTQPLLMLVIVLVTVNVSDLAARPFTDAPVGLYTVAFVLILVYAVFRWASGRHCAIAVVLMIAVLILATVTAYTGIGDAIGGAIVFFAPAELGVLVRNQVQSRRQEIEEGKLREREQLARELHDTVAHHVSAIAIRAQAGRALAPGNPQAAVDALEVIEEEASRTLSEMRTMVGALRGGEAPEFAPQPGVGDIERLAADADAGLPIRVEIDGDFSTLSPSVDTALYRIAQESITNAKRHARRASFVDVSLTNDADFVRLTVRDDGQDGLHLSGLGAYSGDGPEAAAGPRFGLTGMAERAKLLGGAFHAGPCFGGGWAVEATFPRNGFVPSNSSSRTGVFRTNTQSTRSHSTSTETSSAETNSTETSSTETNSTETNGTETSSTER